MAQNNDDLADALSALAGGQVHEEPEGSGVEHTGGAQHNPPPTPPKAVPASGKSAPTRPAAPGGAAPARSARPGGASPARPAAPAPSANPRAAGPSRPATPVAPRAASPAPRARPATPIARPAAPPATAAHPIAPNLTPPEPGEAAADQPVEPVDPHAIYDDGDAVIVPQQGADVFRNKAKPSPKPRQHYSQTLEFKRTVIPILLTLGVIALLSAAVPMVAPPNSALAAVRDQTLMLVMLLIVGVLFLAFGVMNMLQVKIILESRR